eukprot:178006_1
MDSSEDLQSSDFTSISIVSDLSTRTSEKNLKTFNGDLGILFDTQHVIDESPDAILQQCFADKEFVDLFGGYKALARLLSEHADTNQLQYLQCAISDRKAQSQKANRLSFGSLLRMLDLQTILSLKQACTSKITEIYSNANQLTTSVYHVANDYLDNATESYKKYRRERNEMMIDVLHKAIEMLRN